jgi:hypothetical protein
MMRFTSLLLVVAIFVLSSCGQTAKLQTDPVHASDSFRISHKPPQPKDIVEAALASGSVPLTVSPSCKNVGTESSDATIGRYLAGFLTQLSPQSGKNWIDASEEPGISMNGEPVWVCQLIVRHVDGDDRWGWGFRFQVRQSDGLVLRNSFNCTGAG